MSKYNFVDFFSNKKLVEIFLEEFPNLKNFDWQISEEENKQFNFTHLASFAHHESGFGVDLFKQKINTILRKKSISEEEKKLIINIVLYGLAAADIFDKNELLVDFIDEFFAYVDLEAVFVGDLVFGVFENNLLKCLIYNEKWHSVNSLLNYFSKKGIDIPRGHKDVKGRLDIAALIVNCAPEKIMEQYLQSFDYEIDWFDCDADGRYPIELLIIFGRADVLQKIKDKVFERLDLEPELWQIIDKSLAFGLEEANKIILQNGGGHCLNPKVCVVWDGLEGPIDRPNKYDVPLRTQIAIENSSPEFVSQNPMAKSVELGLRSRVDDDILIKIINGVDYYQCSDLVEKRGHKNMLLLMESDQRSILVGRDVNKNGHYPLSARAEFFSEEDKHKTRRQKIEEGRLEIDGIFSKKEIKSQDSDRTPLLTETDPSPSPSSFGKIKKILSSCVPCRK